jgi:hypothetical protein
MLTMLLEMSVYILGAVVLGYLVFALFFSEKPKSAPKPSHQKPRRFERREGERGDRRKQDQGPPPGVEDRRKGSRRSSD